MNVEAIFAEFVKTKNAFYAQELRELRAGRKKSHRTSFIFPQMAGLDSSAVAQKFGIKSKAEAERYLQHPVLGSRLRECTQLLLQLPDHNITLI